MDLDRDLTARTVEIVAAYVAHNVVPRADVPAFIIEVHGALASLADDSPSERVTPRMPIGDTITPDHIVSLEDGRPYRTLKRHLRSRGLTPETYREKWGLPADYPMVAPSYSQRRSALARDFGLSEGRWKGKRQA